MAFGTMGLVAVDGGDVWIRCTSGSYTGLRYTLPANELEPYVEPETMTESGLEVFARSGCLGSQSVVGDDDPIAMGDEAASR